MCGPRERKSKLKWGPLSEHLHLAFAFTLVRIMKESATHTVRSLLFLKQFTGPSFNGTPRYFPSKLMKRVRCPLLLSLHPPQMLMEVVMRESVSVLLSRD